VRIADRGRQSELPRYRIRSVPRTAVRLKHTCSFAVCLRGAAVATDGASSSVLRGRCQSSDTLAGPAVPARRNDRTIPSLTRCIVAAGFQRCALSCFDLRVRAGELHRPLLCDSPPNKAIVRAQNNVTPVSLQECLQLPGSDPAIHRCRTDSPFPRELADRLRERVFEFRSVHRAALKMKQDCL
jgi:hypothetical protein